MANGVEGALISLIKHPEFSKLDPIHASQIIPLLDCTDEGTRK